MTFRDLVSNGVIVPGVWGALSAQLAKEAGFKSLALSGFALEATQVGAPDLGLMTATEVASQALRIISATDLPLIVDIDTGFGGVNNIWRTVRDLELLGVSAVHIEDQTSPKRCPNLSDTEVQTRDEAVLRVQAAVDARRSEEFVVIARSDAHDFDELVIRSNIYLEAGADIAMPVLMSVNGIPIGDLPPDRQMETAAKLASEIDGDVCWTQRQIPPGYTATDIISAGYSIVMYPIDALRASVAGMRRLFASIAQEDTVTKHYEAHPEDEFISSEFAVEVLAMNDFVERERKFAVPRTSSR
jgi:2,3-dimethylmalate lyase